jgi:hypothetical protein
VPKNPLAGDPLFDRLARELSGSELTSALLDVMAARAGARTPADVLAQYRRDSFVSPAATDLRVQHAIDGHLLDAAVGFDAIELSPVAPLGTCSTVAPTSQHRVLSALRSTEVVSDPTNVLALECATRLRANRGTAVHLATAMRVMRAQSIPKLPGYAHHFRMFALASAGSEGVDHAFTVDTLALHVRTVLAGLARLEEHGYAFGARRLVVRCTPARAALAERIASRSPVPATIEPLEQAYYHGLRAMLHVTAPDGEDVFLSDTGAFDWLAKLTANRRAVFVASGCGSQLIAIRFRVR